VINNLFEQPLHPLSIDQFDAEAVKLKGHQMIPSKVRFQNNIVSSIKGRGIGLLAEAHELAKKNWQVGHNCYLTDPVGPSDLARQPTDLIRESCFLSDDPKDLPRFKRIGVDSPPGQRRRRWRPAYLHRPLSRPDPRPRTATGSHTCGQPNPERPARLNYTKKTCDNLN